MDKVKQAAGQAVESMKLAVQDPDVHEAASRPGTSIGTKLEKGLEKGAELAETTAHKINPDTMTTFDGRPVGDNYNSITAGKQGPVLLTEDVNLYEKNVRSGAWFQGGEIERTSVLRSLRKVLLLRRMRSCLHDVEDHGNQVGGLCSEVHSTDVIFDYRF
jgi:hypothetical protein